MFIGTPCTWVSHNGWDFMYIIYMWFTCDRHILWVQVVFTVSSFVGNYAELYTRRKHTLYLTKRKPKYFFKYFVKYNSIQLFTNVVFLDLDFTKQYTRKKSLKTASPYNKQYWLNLKHVQWRFCIISLTEEDYLFCKVHIFNLENDTRISLKQYLEFSWILKFVYKFIKE